MNRRYRTATHEQQKQLLQDGSPEALNHLAESIMPWAIKVALRFARNHCLDDLEALSCANYAVDDAIRRWDPSRGKLTTYTYRCVQSHVSNAKARNYPVSIPRYYVESPRKRSKSKYVRQLDAATQPAADSRKPLLSPHPTPPQVAEHNEKCHCVREALKKLPPRQHAILYARFYDNRPLTAIADILSISKERVRQIECDALDNLHDALKHLTL